MPASQDSAAVAAPTPSAPRATSAPSPSEDFDPCDHAPEPEPPEPTPPLAYLLRCFFAPTPSFTEEHEEDHYAEGMDALHEDIARRLDGPEGRVLDAAPALLDALADALPALREARASAEQFGHTRLALALARRIEAAEQALAAARGEARDV